MYNKPVWLNPHFIAHGKVSKTKGKMWAAMMGSSRSERGESGAGPSSGGGGAVSGSKKKQKGKRKMVLVNGRMVPKPEPAVDWRTVVLGVLVALLVAMLGMAAL